MSLVIWFVAGAAAYLLVGLLFVVTFQARAPRLNREDVGIALGWLPLIIKRALGGTD